MTSCLRWDLLLIYLSHVCGMCMILHGWRQELRLVFCGVTGSEFG